MTPLRSTNLPAIQTSSIFRFKQRALVHFAVDADRGFHDHQARRRQDFLPPLQQGLSERRREPPKPAAATKPPISGRRSW